MMSGILAQLPTSPSYVAMSALVCLLSGLLLFSVLRSTGRGLSRLPGPPSLPIIGNIWRLNPKSAWYELARLKEKYGEWYNLSHIQSRLKRVS